jgi:hypothetical protein
MDLGRPILQKFSATSPVTPATGFLKAGGILTCAQVEISPEDPKLSWFYATMIYQYPNYYPLKDKHCPGWLLPSIWYKGIR